MHWILNYFPAYKERHLQYLISNSPGSVAISNNDYDLCYERYISPVEGQIFDFYCFFGYSGQYFIIKNMLTSNVRLNIAEIELYEGKQSDEC